MCTSLAHHELDSDLIITVIIIIIIIIIIIVIIFIVVIIIMNIIIDVTTIILQELERIKAEMAAIQCNPDLSQDEKKNRGEVKMRELYSASGNAKVRGAVEQVERALEEGELP